MEHRAERGEVEQHVFAETKELKEQLGLPDKTLKAEFDMQSFTTALRVAVQEAFQRGELHDEHRFPELADMKNAWHEIPVYDGVEKDWEPELMLLMKWWIVRLLLVKRVESLDKHTYNGATVLMEFFTSGACVGAKLCWSRSMRDDGHINQCQPLFERRKWEVLILPLSKPTRLIRKIFGEKIATRVATMCAIKSIEYELHLTKKYIPEIYHYIREDESCDSCMSKDSEGYDLPDHLHPVMAYEDSPNAVLALLYNKSKRRWVGRAIAMHDEDGCRFVTSYGNERTRPMLTRLGLDETDCMEGLLLQDIEYEGNSLAPYIDGRSECFDKEGGMLVVRECGEFSSCYETGRLRVATCYDCGESIPSLDDTIDLGGNMICQHCAESYVWCEDVDDNRHADDATWCEDVSEYRAIDYWYCDWKDCHFSDDERRYEVSVRGRHYTNTYYVCEAGLSECLDEWDVIAIDGDVIEQEDEEDAA